MAGGTGVSLRADQSVTFHRRRASQRTGKLPVRSYHERRLGSRISMIIRSRRRRDLIPQDVARIHPRVSRAIPPSRFSPRRRCWHPDERRPGPSVFRNTDAGVFGVGRHRAGCASPAIVTRDKKRAEKKGGEKKSDERVEGEPMGRWS